MRHGWVACALALIACGSKRDESVCCTTVAQCEQLGVSDPLSCAPGLTCVDTTCVDATCAANTDCPTAAPVCELATGTCVECETPTDCPADRPVCDAKACRACALDTDCGSGACADDGTCVAESAIIYLDAATGADTGDCTRAAPCKRPSYGLSKTNLSRWHIRLAPGTYVDSLVIDSGLTSAPSIHIHGSGATMQSPVGPDSSTIRAADVPTTIQDLVLHPNGSAGAAISPSVATCTLRRLKLEDTYGLSLNSDVDATDIVITGTQTAINLHGGSHLKLDRATIHGTREAIDATQGSASVAITNLLVYGTTSLALNMPSASGTIAFSTIADAGSDSGSGPRAVACSPGLAIQNSIIWAPGAAARVPLGGMCSLSNTIAGPVAITGAENDDPQFVDEAGRDYHLGAASPAVDQADTGPATDVDGDPRPKGDRYDLGAVESR